MALPRDRASQPPTSSSAPLTAFTPVPPPSPLLRNLLPFSDSSPTLFPYLLPPRSRKPSRNSRSSSSSVAALDGAHTRIRGLGAEGGA